MKISVVVAVLLSFVICVALGPVIIPALRRLKIGQNVRDDGPQAHLKKSGTPTMGGALFLISMVITYLFFAHNHPNIFPIAFLTLGMGIIGFIDDYIKVVKKRSLGLRAWQKLVLQIVVALLFGLYIELGTDLSLAMKIPFMSEKCIDFGVFNIPIMIFIVLATANGTNLTDGLDGLLSSVTCVVATFFTVVALGTATGIEPITCAVVGGLLGFLMYNTYPAKVFMGDTGSLALGGFVAATAYVLHMPLFIPIVGIIYVVEAVSVIIQVLYFKITKGKRFFKMAPIHHHFELCGWSETRVVAVFTTVTILMSLIAMLGI